MLFFVLVPVAVMAVPTVAFVLGAVLVAMVVLVA